MRFQPSRGFHPLAVVLALVAALAGAAENRPRRGAPLPGPGADALQRLDGIFRTLDANGDGRMDRKEFARMAEFSPRMKDDPDRVDYAFQLLDRDQDEKLTQEEFRGIGPLMLAARRQAPPRPAAAQTTAPEKPPTAEQLDFFEKKIRPVLVDKCYKCHAETSEKLKGSLYVDTREGLRRGGDSGPAVVPGDPDASLLVKAMRYTEPDLQMPPKKDGGKLPDDIIADFERWVKMGAPDPRDGKSSVVKRAWDVEKAREHWAFQLPKKPAPPPVQDASWPRTEIDRYILAGLEAKGLKPVADADPRTLVRRLYFDLIGLPPSPEEVAAFVADWSDSSDRAFERLVDKLLASPQFGERWGRHWLDVARYAESSGKENNIIYPDAWRYRDYVIKAFNDDKPYDRFLKEQIAGDLLPIKNDTDWANNLIATGYLAIGPKSHNTRDYRQFQLDVADEQIDAISQGMLGITVACARCHDHKFDPIPQADYYAMAGIFLSTETRFGTPRFVQNNQTTPLIPLPAAASVTEAPPPSPQQVAFMRQALERAKAERDEVLAEAKSAKDRAAFANPRFLRSTTQIAILEKQLERVDRKDENGRPVRYAMGVQDKSSPRDAQILVRGELDKPADTVPRGFVRIVSTRPQPTITRGSGRLELAGWIASPENPLTARVMANRVWLHLFGRGIVPTPDNFGTTGQPPTNQPLLDHLAVSFVENGWSVKRLIKQIVMSRTYRLGSGYDAANDAVDPDNTLHWRMSQRRLDAEAIRDAMLAVSGRLNLTPPVGSPVANTEGPVQQLLRPLPGPGGPLARFAGAGGAANPLQQDRDCRSVYLPIVRDQEPEALDVFDFPESSLVVGDRDDTSVPSQALYLLNSATVQRLADALADRLLATNARGHDLAGKAFELVLGRPPAADELKATDEFFARFNRAESGKHRNPDSLHRAGFAAFCQALLGSAEFRHLH